MLCEFYPKCSLDKSEGNHQLGLMSVPQIYATNYTSYNRPPQTRDGGARGTPLGSRKPHLGSRDSAQVPLLCPGLHHFPSRLASYFQFNTKILYPSRTSGGSPVSCLHHESSFHVTPHPPGNTFKNRLPSSPCHPLPPSP